MAQKCSIFSHFLILCALALSGGLVISASYNWAPETPETLSTVQHWEKFSEWHLAHR